MLAVTACWGASWLAGRVVADSQIEPLVAASFRFIFGCSGLGAVLILTTGFERPPARAWLPMALMGISGIFLYNICFFYGLRFVPAGRASLLASTQPALIYLLMVLAGQERWVGTRVAGLLLAMTGAAVVLAQGNPSRLLTGGASRGDLVILGCMVSWVAYTLIGRWAMRFAPPLTVTVYSTLIGTCLLVATAVATGGFGRAGISTFPVTVWLAFAFLGFLATTLSFVWYLDGVREIGPSAAAVFLNLVPVFGVLLSTVFLGERLTGFTVGGGLLVLIGVRLLNRGQSLEQKKNAEPVKVPLSS